MIAILDYKAGNQTSVLRALNQLNISGRITNNLNDLDEYWGIIFPGVGSAAKAMIELSSTGLDKALQKAVDNGKPLLGICLGSQILLDWSEEGNTKTLGIIKGKCKRFAKDQREEDGKKIRIPHMGWNGLIHKKETILLKNIPADAEFYFVHSYYNEPDESLVLATTYYGSEFCSIYGRTGLWATQFHPEKSGRYGLQILANFNDYCREIANVV